MVDMRKARGLQMAAGTGNGRIAGQQWIVEQMSAKLKARGGGGIFFEIVIGLRPAFGCHKYWIPGIRRKGQQQKEQRKDCEQELNFSSGQRS